jgi:hypothetical protein
MFAKRHLAAVVFLVAAAAVAGGCIGESTPSPVSTAHRTTTPARTSHPAGASASPRASAATPAPSISSTATGGPVARGGNYCSLLAPGDFTAAGISGAGAPTINTDENGGHYCVYSGTSGATGGIELDVFTGDPVGTYQTIVGETGTVTELAAADLPGADQAGINLNSTGGMAAIVVRSGQLTFDMSFPANPQARSQLLALAALVLARGTALT